MITLNCKLLKKTAPKCWALSFKLSFLQFAVCSYPFSVFSCQGFSWQIPPENVKKMKLTHFDEEEHTFAKLIGVNAQFEYRCTLCPIISAVICHVWQSGQQNICIECEKQQVVNLQTYYTWCLDKMHFFRDAKCFKPPEKIGEFIAQQMGEANTISFEHKNSLLAFISQWKVVDQKYAVKARSNPRVNALIISCMYLVSF